MTRPSWFLSAGLILGAVAVVALVLTASRTSTPQQRPARASAEGANAVQPSVEPRVEHAPASVRVQQEFVEVAMPAVPRHTPRVQTPQPVIRLADRSAGPAARPQRALRDQSVLGKARRALLGDGRYRPEPFPRVREQ
jgi:hypothetical protein